MKRLLLCIIAMLALLAGCGTAPSGSGIDSQVGADGNVSIQLPESTEGKGIDRVIAEASLIGDSGLPIKRIAEELPAGAERSLSLDLRDFGRYEIVMKLYSGSELVDTLYSEAVVTADEYNIALLSATVPVTYTSLYLADSDAGEDALIDSSLPTVIALERADAYDWTALPDMVIPCPFYEEGAYQSGINSIHWDSMVAGMARYIGYLHTLNPDSRFNIIVNDFDSFLVLPLALGNGLHPDQFSLTMISDGNGTYTLFRDIFGDGSGEDASLQKFDELSSLWDDIRDNALAGDMDASMAAVIGHRPVAYLQRYLEEFAPVIACDSSLDVQWIINRNNADTFGSSAAYQEYVADNANVKVVNMNSLLGSLDTAEAEAFKKLYSFDSEEFEAAEKAGKRVVMFLGTRYSLEDCLEDFLSIMENLYPEEEWVHIYKGHPGDTYQSGRSAMLRDHGIAEVDASIPAEIYCFFEPETVLCGYDSSTYGNAGNEVGFICAKDAIPETAPASRRYSAVFTSDAGYVITDSETGMSCIWDPASPEAFPWS